MKLFYRFAAALTLALAAAGCQTEVVPRESNTGAELSAYFGGASGAPTAVVARPPASAGGAATVAGQSGAGAAAQDAGAGLWDSSWADPCAANLDEITGALLSYFSAHKQLPPTLDNIPKISPSGATISLTCPVSGRRYIYHPEGLKPPLFTDTSGDLHVGGVLILYDPEPSHELVLHLTDGTNDYDVKKKAHLGIVMEPRNGNPNQPLTMSVEHIEPGILEMYLRVNPGAATPAAPPVAPVW